MIRSICTLLILFSTVISYSQNFTLLKNTNPKAKALVHNINTTNDSLVLESSNKILKVEIFNEDYEDIVIVEDFNTKIGLKDIPEGKFVVETKLEDKIVIFGLVRYDYIDTIDNSDASINKIDIAEGNGMMLDESFNVIKKIPNNSLEYILTGTKKTLQTKKNQKFYWAVSKINNESGSSKTMKLVDKESADRMILRHKIELNSASGKLNQLDVWEVYDTTKFMEQQVQNPNFFYTLSSEVFNTTPYFSTHSKVVNL